MLRTVFLFLIGAALPGAQPIDRQALVTRHNPVVTRVDYDVPLTVGNGGFAFGADITGLQTFAAEYQRNGIPVETLSRWAWVTDPNPEGYKLADANKDFTLPDGRVMGFPTRASTPAGDWLRKNPRDLPLGQLALDWNKADGSALVPADIQEPSQTLDLWRGIITSAFKLGGVPVQVTTACDPGSDTVAVKIESALVAAGKLNARIAFPRGHDVRVKNTPGYDWSEPDSHSSMLIAPGVVVREVSGTKYYVTFSRSIEQVGAHAFRPKLAAREPVLEFTVRFSPVPVPAVESVAGVYEDSALRWAKFWRETAAVDFSGSTNPLAEKLENRIILSRYLMAVQMAGDAPPQETGLTCSTWYGKHHTEMIWWHTAQFALWGQDAALEKNLAWFQAQLPAARALAASRGLQGARWAKMTGPEMRESPGGNPLIVWNQPHVIALAELLYRNRPTPATLAKYRELVLETADCLATMVHWNEATQRYDLGPPLWIVQEIYDQATSRNPSFELAYWRYGLETAQQWRTRLGLARDEKWDQILAHLSPPPQKDGKYVALESTPDTWENMESRHDHPSMLMPLGVLSGAGIDRAAMGRTLDAVLKNWDWETKIWGWDYPMIAMTAARLGRPEVATEILLRDGPNNRYLPNGHCPQRSDEKLDPKAPPGKPRREIAVYLPANGAFLSAVALMVAGWDGCTEEFPGIPKDGTWKVRAEGLKRLP
ncbi:MAG TPA: hypothetical protein VG734_14690 [Lacunisphaera sp.]|nr:hypothetical protein [Lacunisphaera sp.]